MFLTVLTGFDRFREIRRPCDGASREAPFPFHCWSVVNPSWTSPAFDRFEQKGKAQGAENRGFSPLWEPCFLSFCTVLSSFFSRFEQERPINQGVADQDLSDKRGINFPLSSLRGGNNTRLSRMCRTKGYTLGMSLPSTRFTVGYPLDQWFILSETSNLR